jgi:4-amino-4-deoxy-L-arabinose transferase-like glycosyltransferase
MSAGYHLYGEIFCSQPPLFLLSIYPLYELLGSTITSARVSVAILSLLGLLGAYLMGKALSGRLGGIAAAVLLVATPMYLAQSQILQAEGPATAFLFLTIGAALMWWEHPVGRKGVTFAVLCAVTLALGILIKLLDIVAVVPILLLVLARIWHIRHDKSPNVWVSLRPIAAAIVTGVIATLIVLAPYLHSLNALVEQVVTFHLTARKTMINTEPANVHTLGQFFTANRVLSTVAIIGVAVTVMRRDWRIVPLLAWLLATLVVLSVHVPLWPQHAIVLIPPLIAIIALCLKDLPPIPMRWPNAWEHRAALLMSLLTFAVVIFSIRQDYYLYRDLRVRAANYTQRTAQIAADLERATTPDQWIITGTHLQFVAALANRDTPPWLADTSVVRVLSGFLTNHELLQAGADARVHAIVFETNRLTAAPFARFRPWITKDFSLRHTYDTGVELWIR